MPVRALSKLFRARFQHLLRETPIFAKIPSRVWYKDWVVHCEAVGNGQAALKYLAPYVYRVAISNRRLTKMVDTGHIESSLVTFQYRGLQDPPAQTLHALCRKIHSPFPATCPPPWLCEDPLLRFLWSHLAAALAFRTEAT